MLGSSKTPSGQAVGEGQTYMGLSRSEGLDGNSPGMASLSRTMDRVGVRHSVCVRVW